MKEEHLLTGLLEPTNEPYAIAKIAAIKLCRYYHEQYGADFISVMPTNVYGPHDNFDPETSHVLPALIRRFHEAKLLHQPKVTLWGTGKPFREFLYVDDLAEACCFLMERFSYSDIGEFVNIGAGKDLTIRALAELVRDVVGYEGEIEHDISKPDGTPKKLLDVSKILHLGWSSKVSLRQGLEMTYAWYVAHGAKNDAYDR
jgi:GDP-L-fucose synthase